MDSFFQMKIYILMAMTGESLRFLSQEQMQTIHHNALRILFEIDCVYHNGTLEYLSGAGCIVNMPKQERHLISITIMCEILIEYIKRGMPQTRNL